MGNTIENTISTGYKPNLPRKEIFTPYSGTMKVRSIDAAEQIPGGFLERFREMSNQRYPGIDETALSANIWAAVTSRPVFSEDPGKFYDIYGISLEEADAVAEIMYPNNR